VNPGVVSDTATLARVVERFGAADRYAIDTEFHRERSYYPKLALVQLADNQGTVIIDPLAVDASPLAEVMAGPGLAVAHAAEQDLEVMELACGAIPSRLFDTQVAAGFLGLSTPSLASLVERVVGERLPKASRLADWLRRPLTDEQVRYAGADVDHLLTLAAELEERLGEVGRIEWARQECELLRMRRRGPAPVEEAWLRLRDCRSLRGPARGVAQEVAAWREQTAALRDRPVRSVLSDLAVLSIAQQPPRDEHQLRQRRGVDGRHLGGEATERILAAVERGQTLPATEVRVPPHSGVDAALRPAVTLVSAWLSQLGRDLAIAPATLATRADIEAFLRGDDDARLATGWRGDLVGELIRRLVDGEVALAFAGDGRLALEARSGQTITVELPVPDAVWS
jgi:ribonuclease D